MWGGTQLHGTPGTMWGAQPCGTFGAVWGGSALMDVGYGWGTVSPVGPWAWGGGLTSWFLRTPWGRFGGAQPRGCGVTPVGNLEGSGFDPSWGRVCVWGIRGTAGGKERDGGSEEMWWRDEWHGSWHCADSAVIFFLFSVL